MERAGRGVHEAGAQFVFTKNLFLCFIFVPSSVLILVLKFYFSL
jgi:hypothetical protein